MFESTTIHLHAEEKMVKSIETIQATISPTRRFPDLEQVIASSNLQTLSESGLQGMLSRFGTIHGFACDAESPLLPSLPHLLHCNIGPATS